MVYKYITSGCGRESMMSCSQKDCIGSIDSKEAS